MAVGEGFSSPDDDTKSSTNTDNALTHTEDRPPAEDHPNSDGDDETEEEEEEDEEPRLKYANLTKNLVAIYRGGDAASAFFVAGEKLIIGTDKGSVSVLNLPSLDVLKRYQGHSATISSISISPYPPPLPTLKLESTQRLVPENLQPEREGSPARPSPAAKDSPRQNTVAQTAANQIYIATSSIDGKVCVQSLVDPKDVQLRNFGRPVQTVALSPEYRTDRTYLSGGNAGSLVLTIGGQLGKETNATITGAAAAASGWLGSVGLGSDTGSDRVLHSGEGNISTIRWSLSGKFVLWVNEQGIKVMRSHLHLSSNQTGMEWKRLSHIDRPSRPTWEDMAGAWKARVEWIDRNNLETDDRDASHEVDASSSANGSAIQTSQNQKVNYEEVTVGWGDSIWIIRVYPGDEQASKPAAENKPRAEVATIIRFDDCTISGVSLYTPTTLLVLAYLEKKQSAKSTEASNGAKKGRRRQYALEPELRLVDINTKEEIDSDTLTINRFDSLASSDYNLSILPPMRIPAALAQRGYLGQLGGALGTGMSTVGSGLYTGVETVGQGMWDATMYGPRKLGANRLFSTGESIRSGRVDSDKPASERNQRNYLTGWLPGFGSSTAQQDDEVKDVAQTRGMKIFIFSPYDCIVAVRRNLADRLQWLVSMERYEQAWKLLDEHPEAAGPRSEASDSGQATPSKASSVAKSASVTSGPSVAAKQHATLAEFFADSASLTSTVKGKNDKYSAAEKEKRRIGELWLKQLVAAQRWPEAGEVAGKALDTTTRWEHWVWIFIKNQKFDEISPFVPTLDLTPPLPSLVFEIILGHYVAVDRQRFRELLDQWPSDIFDISSITTAIEGQLTSVDQGSEDWRSLQECLAKLFLADGRYDEALRCYIHLQDADTALSLIKDHHLIEAVADDIPAFVQLRVSAQQLSSAPREELLELASEPIKLLVDEAEHGLLDPSSVVEQLETAKLPIFLYFYLRGLWLGEGSQTSKYGSSSAHVRLHDHSARLANTNLAADAGHLIVEQFADRAVSLFAEYDHPLLSDFLHTSTAYTFDLAVRTCESRHLTSELVYLLAKTGQVKKALFLIIDELHDVSAAIEFAKEQDDKELWDDFLEYSMSRPRFISGLLSEVGMAIDPIRLVKRIPSGLEIEGLKEGLGRMLREYDLQDSISAGVARVLESEVAVGMERLRVGRRCGVKFDVVSPPSARRVVGERTETSDESVSTTQQDGGVQGVEYQGKKGGGETEVQPGHCASCRRAFSPEGEQQTLVGFACGHVYHVAHLLHGPEAEDAGPGYLPDLHRHEDGEGDDEGSRGFTRSVSSKVTNARLLRERIAAVGGCVVCKKERERVKEVE